MYRFTLPKDMYFGKDSLCVLKTISGKKALIVLGSSFIRKQGFLQKVIDYLEAGSIQVRLFEGVEPDPSVETVKKGAQVMREYEPDIIIGMGTAAPIDAAKVMHVLYEHPGIRLRDVFKPFSLPEVRKKAIFIAIPSISGSSTEVTGFAKVMDYENNLKYDVMDYNITPDITIIDPSLSVNLPRTTIGYSGVDALAHGIEAYGSKMASPISDALAIKSVKTVVKDLVNAYGGDMNSRENIIYAQSMAGMAYSNAYLGVSHSLASIIGDGFHIPHGVLSGLVLPYIIGYNKPTRMDKYAYIGRVLGLEGKNDNVVVDELISLVIGLNRKIGIPYSLKEYGLDEQEFKDNIKMMAKEVSHCHCSETNPRKPSEKEIIMLLNCIYYGVKISF
ncbi:iron-containing alcohol dehydrogenase [Clostridium sp.]|uniref:iron-containing alcohol dehydrogenase n=1 Tax=Clostridium sp. TaxID=1506 RepID=UPI002FCBAE64